MPTGRERFSFGPFILDPVERRLVRGGEAVALGGKAFQVLVLLVERHGELVTREELLEKVWSDVAVDDAVITVNISTVRKALRFEGNEVTYIQTVPRAGYRFVGPVTRVIEPEIVAPAGTVTLPGNRVRVAFVTAAAAIALSAALVWGMVARRVTPQPPPLQRQITANPLTDPVARGAISPDGRYFAYSDLRGIHIRLIETGATRLVTPPPGYCFR